MLAVPRPREGDLWRGENFGSALLQPARSVCLSSERFFSLGIPLHELIVNLRSVSSLLDRASSLEWRGLHKWGRTAEASCGAISNLADLTEDASKQARSRLLAD